MIVGHYAVGLALKSVDRNASLGMLFIVVQFVDILFLPLTLMGIEHYNIVKNITESTHFDLYFMPYTHSLFASFLWAGLFYIAYRFIFSTEVANRNKTAIVMGVAVLSHWFLDLIVHTSDLPLLIDDSIKIGFGLWNNAIGTYVLEAVLLLAGLAMYLKSTKSTEFAGKYGMIIFVVFMLIMNVNNIFGPPLVNNTTTMSILGLLMYFSFSGVAFWLDKKRS